MSLPRSAMSSPTHAHRPSTSSALRYSLLPSNRRTASLGSPNAFFERDGRQTLQPGSPSGLPRHRSKDSISRGLGLPPIPTSAPPRWRRRAAFAVTAALVCAALLAFGTRTTGSRSGGLDENGRVPVGFEAQDVPAEWKCDPFKQPGRLQVDTQNKYNNVWRPYDEDCPASQLFQGMIRGVNKSREIEQAGQYAQDGPRRAQDTTLRSPASSDGIVHYPWLVNATVLLVGDSMERLHLNDFCDLVGGEATNIHPKHYASPPPYHKSLRPVFGADGLETVESKLARGQRKQLEDAWEKREHTWNYMRPWVCDVKEYNFTMLFAFAWGMEDMESIFQSEDFYHAPSTWLERFHHIALPLLHNVANHLKRPQVAHPTLIEISSGYWDLRAMTEQDFIAAGYSKPYPKDTDLAFGPIGLSRERNWVKNVRRVIKDVAQFFPGAKGIRDGPPILWRTLHHVKRNNYTPYSRVTALDALARKTMHELRLSSLATYPSSLSALFGSSPYQREARKHLAREKQRRAGPDQDGGDADLLDSDGTDYGFDERLRVDEIGRLLEGQEHHMRDDLHPEALPGSYVWADILLYELKRAYYRVGRTDQHI